MSSNRGGIVCRRGLGVFFFFNDTATTEIYTLSLHDALPISDRVLRPGKPWSRLPPERQAVHRSEEHTSELQSQSNLVCRLLLEKKKKHDPEMILYDRNSHVDETETTITVATYADHAVIMTTI